MAWYVGLFVYRVLESSLGRAGVGRRLGVMMDAMVVRVLDFIKAWISRVGDNVINQLIW